MPIAHVIQNMDSVKVCPSIEKNLKTHSWIFDGDILSPIPVAVVSSTLVKDYKETKIDESSGHEVVTFKKI